MSHMKSPTRNVRILSTAMLLQICASGGLGLSHAAEPSFKLPPETAILKSAPGVELVQGQCVLCHSLDYISTQPRLTSTQWRATLTKMQSKYGAPLVTNTVDQLVDYLTRNYGRPNP